MVADRALSYGMVPLDVARDLSGLVFLQRMLSGELPHPPICSVLRFRLTEVERGRIVVEGETSADLYNPLGSVHGGYTATLLDTCMGCAAHTTLDAGQGYTTLEFKVNFVRPLTDRTGSILAEGKIISAGRRIATAEGRLLDKAGQLYAHATTTCLVFPL